MSDVQDRVYCPVCQAKFRFMDAWSEGDTVVCPVCGQRLVLRREGGSWVGDRAEALTEEEIRDRVEHFAELKGYRFSDVKEEVIEGLLGKRKLFGDFYCPCRMLHTPDYQCPCRPTRGGDVEKNGRCHCGLFWK